MKSQRDIIVIGASLGGLDALCKLLSGFAPGLEAALLVVTHTHRTSPLLLASLLEKCANLTVAYAQ